MEANCALGHGSSGRGFYEFSFASAEDLRVIWAVGDWNLHPGLLRLSQWSPDFHPSNQKLTHVQCWIRTFDLPQEFWRPKILFEIVGSLGTPISLDESTRNKIFGHYARFLVDVDLKDRLFDKILVERKEFAFFRVLNMEDFPPFVLFVK